MMGYDSSPKILVLLPMYLTYKTQDSSGIWDLAKLSEDSFQLKMSVFPLHTCVCFIIKVGFSVTLATLGT